MRPAIPLIALTVIGLGTPAGAARRALVVGERVGAGSDAPLRFAEDDAAAMAEALEDTGSVSRGELTLLRGASLREVRAELKGMATASQPGDELVFFYSGHGGADGAHVRGEVWRWEDLRADLEAVHARLVVAFVDACFSGALLTPKGLVRESPLVVSLIPLGGRGRFLVTSSGANELSYESSLLQGSPFAEALRSGLRGAADANGDGRVTLPELYDFIYRRTLTATLEAPSGAQHPLQSSQLESAGEVVMSDLHARSQAAVRGSAVLGHCYVLDTEGVEVLAESQGANEELFLAPGDYQATCVKADQVLASRFTLGSAGVSLDGLRFTAVDATAPIAKGSSARTSQDVFLAVGASNAQSGGALRLGYEIGSEEVLGSAVLSATWRGELLALAGVGTRLPWLPSGDFEAALGLELAAAAAPPFPSASLGGGSFLSIASPPLLGPVRAMGRFDLLALEPLSEGRLEAALVGSLGAELEW